MKQQLLPLPLKQLHPTFKELPLPLTQLQLSLKQLYLPFETSVAAIDAYLLANLVLHVDVRQALI